MLRAAGRVIGFDRIIVVGSQAVLATVAEFMLPLEATMSVETDLIALDGTEASADKIDGAIGEASTFHESFGIYAQGVGYETIVAPAGWRDRLIEYSNENTSGVTGLCLEINDLWLTKLAAGRAGPRRPGRACPRRAHHHGQHGSAQAQRRARSTFHARDTKLQVTWLVGDSFG